MAPGGGIGRGLGARGGDALRKSEGFFPASAGVLDGRRSRRLAKEMAKNDPDVGEEAAHGPEVALPEANRRGLGVMHAPAQQDAHHARTLRQALAFGLETDAPKRGNNRRKQRGEHHEPRHEGRDGGQPPGQLRRCRPVPVQQLGNDIGDIEHNNDEVAAPQPFANGLGGYAHGVLCARVLLVVIYLLRNPGVPNPLHFGVGVEGQELFDLERARAIMGGDVQRLRVGQVGGRHRARERVEQPVDRALADHAGRELRGSGGRRLLDAKPGQVEHGAESLGKVAEIHGAVVPALFVGACGVARDEEEDGQLRAGKRQDEDDQTLLGGGSGLGLGGGHRGSTAVFGGRVGDLRDRFAHLGMGTLAQQCQADRGERDGMAEVERVRPLANRVNGWERKSSPGTGTRTIFQRFQGV